MMNIVNILKNNNKLIKINTKETNTINTTNTNTNSINNNKFSNSVKINNEIINNEYNILKNYSYNNKENRINILIRTSNRPQYFDTCINSILNQKYDNYHIFICYDKIESLNYLSKYSTHHKITYFSVSVNSKEKYRFNLYNNILIEKVNSDEWIMFLDDDDKLTHEYVLKTINENIKSDNDLLIWKFMRPDRLIYPTNIYNVTIGTIDTTCFCFNKKYLKNSKWGDKQCGDFYFFNRLVTNNKFNRKFINYIFTKTIFENKIASFGN